MDTFVCLTILGDGRSLRRVVQYDPIQGLDDWFLFFFVRYFTAGISLCKGQIKASLLHPMGHSRRYEVGVFTSSSLELLSLKKNLQVLLAAQYLILGLARLKKNSRKGKNFWWNWFFVQFYSLGQFSASEDCLFSYCSHTAILEHWLSSNYPMKFWFIKFIYLRVFSSSGGNFYPLG